MRSLARGVARKALGRVRDAPPRAVMAGRAVASPFLFHEQPFTGLLFTCTPRALPRTHRNSRSGPLSAPTPEGELR